VTAAGFLRDTAILACAVSAGIHAALAPDHFAEGSGAGAGFLAGAILLALFAVALTLRPSSRTALAGAASVLAGLIFSYVLAITTGLPFVHPDPEPVAAVALVTKAVETLGLVAAICLLWRSRIAAAIPPHN
jgi:hypothetical protein